MHDLLKPGTIFFRGLPKTGKMCHVRIACICLFLALPAFLLVKTARARDLPGLAVLKLTTGEGVEPGTAALLEELILTEIQRTGLFKTVIGHRDIKAMLSLEEQRQKLTGCADDACIAELGGALGVSYVASAVIGRLGEKLVLNMKLIDVKGATVIGRASRATSKHEDLLIKAIKELVNEVVVEPLSGNIKTGKEMALIPAGWFWMGCGKPSRPAPAAAGAQINGTGLSPGLGEKTQMLLPRTGSLADSGWLPTSLSIKFRKPGPRLFLLLLIVMVGCSLLAATMFTGFKPLFFTISLGTVIVFIGACGALKFKKSAQYARECRHNEKPGHWVYLPDYYMDKHEVTLKEYKACVQAGSCVEPPDGNKVRGCNWNMPDRDGHPINCVTWQDAQAYCYWAKKRLPTEAEWEKAARGEKARIFPWGDNKGDCSLAVITEGRRGCGRDTTWAVCRKERGNSPYGLCDMAGNVWEWTGDWYGSFRPTSVHMPNGPSKGKEKVLKGGAWGSGPVDVRASIRKAASPLWKDRSAGFRCAMDSKKSRVQGSR
ncbi:MAG: formylglycine-generating enzyme family protein [Deltaproteobacteria bacterium]|nr:formylglycine-generating enzyme family protein [Deltaproteobacteria bacterium]